MGITRYVSDHAPWAYNWTPGPALANLYDLYPSMGDVSILSATNWMTELDGPMKVFRCGTLNVQAALGLTNRTRPPLIICDYLNMGAAGSINFTARGAAGCSKWRNQDLGIPSLIKLWGQYTSHHAHLKWLARTGYFIGDPTLYACPVPGMGDVQTDYADWPARMVAIVSAAGCGAGRAVTRAGSALAGTTGNAGSNGGTAGGGTGGLSTPNVTHGLPSGPGRVWGGGVGSAGNNCVLEPSPPDMWGGQGGPPGGTACGGGGGNPSGSSIGPSSGTGLPLIVIVRFDVTLAAGHAFISNGMPGENGTSAPGGGGTGAGSASLFYGRALNGTPNMQAVGGLGGTGSPAGGQGGCGPTAVKPFSAMNWAA